MELKLQSGMRPRSLGPHGAVDIVSPASCVALPALDAGCEALRALTGWKVETAPGTPASAGGFAGSPEARAEAFITAWQRSDALICARGGYGSNYLLPLLPFDAMKAAPKVFVGYSDNTSLLIALDRAGLVAFHGPMIATDFARGSVDESSFRLALSGEALDFAFSSGSDSGGPFKPTFGLSGERGGVHLPRNFSSESDVRSLVSGEAHGTIIGGCLSVVVTTLGTPWEIETDGRILFLEDVNEKPFRIDRMLMHLLLAGKFRGVRGVIFGAMRGCTAASPDEETLPQVICRILGGLGVPIVLGFPSGHVERGNITLPFGVPAALYSSESSVRLQVEPSTIATEPIAIKS
jgi:muramoyltetrapeptide carboxypeptidase